VLKPITDENLKVYIVWLPIIKQDSQAQVPKAISTIQDKRVLHYWDNNGLLSRQFSFPLGLGGERAYDVFLLYGLNEKWTDKIPNPDYIMHQQLEHVPRGHLLNGEKLAKEIQKRLLLIGKNKN
jgi:hypothetical protein